MHMAQSLQAVFWSDENKEYHRASTEGLKKDHPTNPPLYFKGICNITSFLLYIVF